jgi:hypothetical protein
MHTSRASIAPVIAAEVLIRHGVDDRTIARYLVHWGLDGRDPWLVLHAAHVLFEREEREGRVTSST